jgi:hypothetical protein
MPSRVLVHLPPPEPPRLVDRPPRRPARGEEFPTGWTVADYQLERGEFGGYEYEFEVWVVPLLALDDGPAGTDRAPGESGSPGEHRAPQGTLAAVPTLYGYPLTPEDGDRLVAALTDAGTHASLEAAAAIRWGEAMEVPVDDLEPELCRAILDVLDRATMSLQPVRERLAREAVPPHRRTRLIRSIHNPRRRACGCLDDCWCKRTVWGRAIRWYVPQNRHSSVSPCWKQNCHELGQRPRIS